MEILTLTLNPCVDRTNWVEEFGATPVRTEAQSGGKGVNVARVLTALGVECVSIAPCGGATGERFRSLAEAEGVRVEPVAIAGETRVVDTFVRASDMRQDVRFGAPPEMTEEELNALEEAVTARLPRAKVLLIGGSACCAEAASRLPGIIARAKEKGVRVLLDSNGPALLCGAEGLPDAIKPNQKELSQLCARDIPEGAEEDFAREVIAKGIGMVIVSLGERGCVQVTADAALYCPAPRVKAVNAVGSGDSFTAGWLYAQLRGYSDGMGLAIACAAGAANAKVFPAARIGRREIEALLGYAI